MPGYVGSRGVRSSTTWLQVMGVEQREDALLAGALAVAGLVEVAAGAVPRGQIPLASLSLLVMAAALTARRTRPRASLVVVLLALAVQSFLGVPVNAQLMTNPFIVVAAYSVGAHLDRRSSVVGLGVGAALVAVAVAAGAPGDADYGFALLLVATPWVTGVLVRARHAAASEAVASADTRARRAAEEERQRIARELHDIVAHGLSAMVVQAAAAAELLDRSPQAARRALHDIQSTGTEAMTEMRHMLGVMRGAEVDGRRPQPGLDDVADLVATERAAGAQVSLSIQGTPRELPRGLTLSVYRIIQEALTNVRKHARGSRCEVTIGYTPTSLEVAVSDDGRRAVQGPEGPGYGIVGMRERARLYDGTLEAGPSPAGGWAVRASFPLESERVCS